MKARHIKKLRKEIEGYHPFVIHTSLRLFGHPYSEEKEPIIYAAPGDGTHAVRRYLQWYARKYKMFHPSYSKSLNITTCNNGTFEAIDLQTGFKHYVW